MQRGSYCFRNDPAMSDRSIPVISVLAWLRDASWMTPGRARAYARVFLGATLVVVAVRLALAGTGIGADSLGAPIHADFISFWAAGRLALDGRAADAYRVAAHWAVQRAVIKNVGYSAFFYPPVFLLLCAPLAVLPFYGSLAAFLGATVIAYVRVLTRLLPGAGVALLGFPGVAVNLIYGQNGFLTTTLFGAALLALERRRAVLAGFCFGCLCYKPHLGLVVPLALLALGAWRAAFAAAATVLGLVAASVTAFGIGPWQGFLDAMPLARHVQEHGLMQNVAWVSTFRAAVQAGIPFAAAWAMQGAVTLAACVAVVLACRARPASAAGILPLAALLATPFLLAYDLVLLAVPLVWLLRDARATRFLPWEKAALMTGFVLPLLSLFAGFANLPLAPVVMLALLGAVLRRALAGDQLGRRATI